jgi:ribosomal protein S18 acetylase RimI-like enzyme
MEMLKFDESNITKSPIYQKPDKRTVAGCISVLKETLPNENYKDIRDSTFVSFYQYSEKIAAAASYNIEKDFPTNLHLGLIGVDQKYRGRGIATNMTRGSVNYILKKNLKIDSIGVILESQGNALATIKKLGFTDRHWSDPFDDWTFSYPAGPYVMDVSEWKEKNQN